MASANFSVVHSLQTEHSEPNSSDQPISLDREHHGYSDLSILDDSGTFTKETLPCTESIEPCDQCLCDHVDTNGFSEEELLNITFETCDTTEGGEVLASSVVQYLQTMTCHSAGQDKLIVLQRMLDPEDQDPPLSRDTFHTTMKKWIAQCSIDSFGPGSDACKAPGNGDECFPLLAETTFTDQGECHCESTELLALVAELKHAQYRLRGHNMSLLRTVSQCEDTNLQLTLEISELRSKLTSAQLCVERVRGLADDLDEARQALKESQERTARAQANSHALLKETEHLKVHIKVVEEKNEKLLHERNCAEDRVAKLKRANTDIREELEEMQVLLKLKESEISKKNITLQKLTDTYLEYNRITEGLQFDLKRLQEQSKQVILRFDKCPVSNSGLKSGYIPNYYSLHHEMLEAQPSACTDGNSGLGPEIQTPSSSRRGYQNIIDKITSADLKQVLHAPYISKRDAFTTKILQCQQDKTRETSSKRIMTILRELEQPQPVCDQHQEHRLTQTTRQTKEVHKAVTWWKALRPEGERNCTKDTTDRIRVLEAELIAAQLEVQKGKKELQNVQVLTERKDCAVQTEQMGDESRDEAEKQHTAAEKVLESLRKVEVMVERALQAAEVLTESERMIKDRMKMIGHRVEEAICRATVTENQMSTLEAQVARTLSSDVSATPDEADVRQPEVCRNMTEPGSQSSSSATKGGLLLCAGAEDHIQEGQGASQDTDYLPQASNDSSEPLVICVNTVILEASASDYFPVGLVKSPSVQKETVQGSKSGWTAHRTSTGPTCETQENVAGPEEPRNDDDCLLKSEETESHVVLPEKPSTGQTPRPQEGKCFSNNQETNGRLQAEPASFGSSESGPGQVSVLVEKEHCEQAFKSANLDSSECVSKYSGCCKEQLDASGRCQENNQSLKEPTLSWSCQTSELGQANQPGASTVKQENASECEATAPSQTEPPSPKALHLALPKPLAPFFFPHTRSRPATAPTMPTLPEEEEDSPEEIDSSSSEAMSDTKVVSVTLAPPAIVLSRQVCQQELEPLEKARPHSPRPRLSRNTSSGPITTVDDHGHVIDLVKDKLPELQLSEKDRQKNLELLEEAKKVSDRFLSRRGRRSTSSLTDSPTAVFAEVTTSPSSSTSQRLEVPAVRDHGEANKSNQESLKKLVEWKPPEKRKVSSGTLTPRHATSDQAQVPAMPQKESVEPSYTTDKVKKLSPTSPKPESQTPATGVAKPVPRPPTQQAPCTAEIKTIGAFPPLMRAVSWDTVGSLNMRTGGPRGDDGGLSFSDTVISPGNQKLSKMREEHKLLRNQSISGPKLPDLSETAEQDRDISSPLTAMDDEAKEKADAMPNISDIMLRKLKLHRGLPGCAPPLTEKEVENAFVQLSLAFRNDNYTLETRLKQAERERNLTEENTEKELDEFKNSLKQSTASLWQNAEQRESYQSLIETVAVLHRLANRLSGRAEMVGAVRQEKRMSKATEVMLQYVENLKRTYEKDHAELMEFKKLANLNSNRCYGSSAETGDEGVPRTGRSMSLTMGKALPRRRVSVAVVPKFNLLNIPGQTPATAGPVPFPGIAAGLSALPVVCEANVKTDCASDASQPTGGENGKVLAEQEGEITTPTKTSCNLEEIRAEMKTKIEEEAYNKGYQEGLKRLKELQELKEEEEKTEENQTDSDKIQEEEYENEKKTNSWCEKATEVLDRICPKVFRRNRTLWIIVSLFFALFFLLNLINFFSNLYSDTPVHTDTSTEKSSVPGKKKFFGLHVGPKRPSPD